MRTYIFLVSFMHIFTSINSLNKNTVFTLSVFKLFEYILHILRDTVQHTIIQ
jgi:hypothetical protein